MKKIYLALLIVSILLIGTVLLASCEINTTEPTTTTTNQEQPAEPGHVHSFKEEVVDPTCTDRGYTHYTCTDKDCGYEYRDSFVEPNAENHVYTETVVAPTCTKEGYTRCVCAICGDSYDKDTVPSAHTFNGENDGWYFTKQPSCQDQGMQRRDCVYCSYYEERQTDAAHSYEGVKTEPTCTTDGYTTYTCTVCGHSYVVTEEKALGHDYTDSAWYVYTEATCDTKGEERRDCTRCDYYDSRAIEKHHFETPVHEDPTCENPGYDGHACTDCGEIKIDTILPACGHKFNDDGWTAVPGMPGYEQRVCENGCGKVEYRER